MSNDYIVYFLFLSIVLSYLLHELYTFYIYIYIYITHADGLFMVLLVFMYL